MPNNTNIVGIYTGEILDGSSFFSAFGKNGYLRSKLRLAISEIQGSKISGEVRTEGVMVGVIGGVFSGTYADGEIMFTTSNGTNRTITWTGTWDGNRFYGKWKEEDRRLFIRMTGGRYTAGEWLCEK